MRDDLRPPRNPERAAQFFPLTRTQNRWRSYAVPPCIFTVFLLTGLRDDPLARSGLLALLLLSLALLWRERRDARNASRTLERLYTNGLIADARIAHREDDRCCLAFNVSPERKRYAFVPETPRPVRARPATEPASSGYRETAQGEPANNELLVFFEENSDASHEVALLCAVHFPGGQTYLVPLQRTSEPEGNKTLPAAIAVSALLAMLLVLLVAGLFFAAKTQPSGPNDVEADAQPTSQEFEREEIAAVRRAASAREAPRRIALAGLLSRSLNAQGSPCNHPALAQRERSRTGPPTPYETSLLERTTIADGHDPRALLGLTMLRQEERIAALEAAPPARRTIAQLREMLRIEEVTYDLTLVVDERQCLGAVQTETPQQSETRRAFNACLRQHQRLVPCQQLLAALPPPAPAVLDPYRFSARCEWEFRGRLFLWDYASRTVQCAAPVHFTSTANAFERWLDASPRTPDFARIQAPHSELLRAAVLHGAEALLTLPQ